MIDELLMEGQSAEIKVVGIGGGGSNVIDMMHEDITEGVNFLVFNTDAQVLGRSKAKNRIQIGEKLTRGLGAGADPEMGYRSMNQDLPMMSEIVDDTDMIFVVACLGGGTGSGASVPFIEMCRKKGILTVAVVTLPFLFEGRKRRKVADQALEAITSRADTTVVLNNDNILKHIEKNIPLRESFRVVDRYLSHNINSVISMINSPGIINLDFADIRTILRRSGVAVFGSGSATGEKRAGEALEKALSSHLLDRNIEKAGRVLLNITGPDDLSLFEINSIAQKVQDEVGEDANIIFGAASNGTEKGEVSVTLLVSGFDD
ncbi:MAG: cell division protein FtsZ [Candidatus Muiribacteriaceae bacterium]